MFIVTFEKINSDVNKCVKMLAQQSKRLKQRLNQIMEVKINIDARKMICPMPLLKLKQALNQVEVGDRVHLTATDRTSLRDIKTYIDMTSHLMNVKQNNNEIHFYVVKG